MHSYMKHQAIWPVQLQALFRKIWYRGVYFIIHIKGMCKSSSSIRTQQNDSK